MKHFGITTMDAVLYWKARAEKAEKRWEDLKQFYKECKPDWAINVVKSMEIIEYKSNRPHEQIGQEWR